MSAPTQKGDGLRQTLQSLSDALDVSTFSAVLSLMRGETRRAIEHERGLIGLLLLSERDPQEPKDRLAILETTLERLGIAHRRIEEPLQ